MNLFGWIINKFRKKDYNIGIIRFGDSIVIPGRDYFKEESSIKLLEEYKGHYLEELSKRSAVTTLSFDSRKLKENMNTNVDLVFRILMDNDDFYLLASEELIVQSAKLKMYCEEINWLENETILRLVALKEIEKEKKVPKRNKMTLEEEINQLSVILTMYSYRKSAISIELKNYMDMISTRELKIDYDMLKKRLDKVLFISDGIYNAEELNNYEDIRVKLAILERECEKYVYQNKNQIKDIISEIDNLIQTEIEESNQNSLKNTCIKLEKKLLLFYEYGKNIVDKEEIEKIYYFKLKLLTFNINFLKESPIIEEDYGFEYYKEIIALKIENILQKEYIKSEMDSYITNRIEYVAKYLKSKDNEYNFKEILLNKYKLSFILAFDYPEGLKNFFNQTKISVNKIELDEFGYEASKIPGITWSGEFPLASYFELMTGKNKHPLYYFYEEYARENNNLIVPMGIETVDFMRLPDSVYNKIKENIKYLNLIECPLSLRRISGYIDLEVERNLVLNNGLEVIGPNVFKFNIGCLTIPSSVKEISSEGNSESKSIRSIKFLDFESSEIVNDKEKLLKFIRMIFKEVDTGKQSIEIQEKYREGGYFTNEYFTNNHVHVYRNYVYELQSVVSDLIFESNILKSEFHRIHDDFIIIPTNLLKCKFLKRSWLYGLVGFPDYEEVYEKIRKNIFESSQHDICNLPECKHKENMEAEKENMNVRKLKNGTTLYI